ncbi:PE-PPE domain-containing protein [Mycolicibacterium agri]|uniref:PE-PPE domain-containing protein n=1 Tax=Mycolicibacterium agri TaxID=36811 RepID=A0A2A7N789_MYCAG|nr:PE-PPE domain-containing protein [Mycolicibacterium agri]PEG39754.1 PE-PPE domain-containing protein [Mycolicibacterium agri]GFG52537.1 PE-PPE domain-containing protein [Mycolicibacterium agri]
MSGKHHKKSRIRSTAAKRAGTGLAAVAVGATSVATAIVTGTAPAISPAVELMALITPANSTSQIFAGTEYYGTDYANSQYVPPRVLVPFFFGPRGIADAIAAADDDPKRTAVISSGWGAGQTGTALGLLGDDGLENVDLVILDNNTNRAGGGFWTTYWPFAPLLLTSKAASPNDLDVTVWDVGYEYNVNGNAVTYPLNVVSDVNSLVAYVYGYGAQGSARLPDDLQPGVHYIVSPNGAVREVALGPGVTTTYVTFESDGLPVVRPLRLIPGGDILADTLEPALTEIVNAGYKDNTPIPDDPTVERPMGLGISESTTALNNLPGAVRTGLRDGAQTAAEDVANPSNFVTKPLDEFRKLPLISTLPNSTVSNNNSTLRSTDPDAKKTTTTSSKQRPRPLKKIAENVRSSLRKLTGADKHNPAAQSENAGSDDS